MLWDFLFPKRCVGCNKIGGYFCNQCVANLEQSELVCPFCERLSIGGVTHPVCRRRFGLDGLWSLGVYSGALKKAIQKLKYRWVRELAGELVNLQIDYWAKHSPLILDKITKDRGQGWIITAVPLHKSRQNWRGFNQSELLGKLLADRIGLKYENLLIRTKNTKTQVGLLSSDRKKNIKGAFGKSNYYSPITNVLIVDDVWTTGSTLRECCYVLKRGGARTVWALTLAR